MPSSWRSWSSTLVIGAALVALSCEQTPLLVPSDGQILISADPVEAEVRPADPTENTLFSTIDATVLSAEGQVLPGVQVTFTRSGGVLCITESGCLQPQTGPLTVDTDENGRARVVLGATESDPSVVDVIARSGAKEATVSVTNPIGDPVPATVAISVPSAVDCEFDANLDCVYSLTASFTAQVTNPSGGTITCYRWALITSGQANPAPQFGPALTTYSPAAFSTEQQVDATVSITDEVGVCDSTTAFEASGQKTIRVCNPANLPPDAVIATPSSTTGSIGGGTATFSLNATGTTDPNGTAPTQLQYRWDCGNGTQTPTGSSVSCSYTTVGQKVVTLTVFDLGQGQAPCARRDTATLTLTVTN